MNSIDLYRAFCNIDDALLEASETLGEASFAEVHAANGGAVKAPRRSETAPGNKVLQNAGRWLRRHSGLVAALAVCIAVGAFVSFGGGLWKAGSSGPKMAPATPASAPALSAAPAEAPAAESNSMPGPSAAAADEEAAPESAEAFIAEAPAEGVDTAANENKSTVTDGAGLGFANLEVIEEINYNDIVYKAVFDDVYRLGDALGEEYQGYPLYAVDGFDTSEMLALFDEEAAAAQFFRAE